MHLTDPWCLIREKTEMLFQSNLFDIYINDTQLASGSYERMQGTNTHDWSRDIYSSRL